MRRNNEVFGRRGAWLVAFFAPAGTAALMVTLRAHTQPSNLALVMVVVVAVSVVPGHRLPAAAAGLSAGVWFDFFVTRPYEEFSIQRSSDAQTTVLLVVVAVVVGEIAARRRSARVQGRVARDEVVGLYVIAQMLSAGARPSVVADAVGEQLRELLSLVSWQFEPEAPVEGDPLINRAGELEYSQMDWQAGRNGLPPGEVNLPVDSGGRAVGRYILRGPDVGVPLTPDRLLVAVALADLVGAAMTAVTNLPDA